MWEVWIMSESQRNAYKLPHLLPCHISHSSEFIPWDWPSRRMRTLNMERGDFPGRTMKLWLRFVKKITERKSRNHWEQQDCVNVSQIYKFIVFYCLSVGRRSCKIAVHFCCYRLFGSTRISLYMIMLLRTHTISTYISTKWKSTNKNKFCLDGRFIVKINWNYSFLLIIRSGIYHTVEEKNR